MISGKGFNDISDMTFCRRYFNHFGSDISNIEENEMFFLNLDLFWEFLIIVSQQKPANKFILITHNSDLSFTDGHFDFIKPFVNKVYAVNNICKQPNVYTIPLGFRDHPWDTMKLIQSIPPFGKEDKDILCYMNFKIYTNKQVRQECWDLLSQKKWVTMNSDLSLEDFYCELNHSKYTISPPGTGLDCHRVYESIYFNVIPILITSQMDYFFTKLPVMIVNTYEELTEEMLEEKYSELYGKIIDWKKENPDWLNPSYWLNSCY